MLAFTPTTSPDTFDYGAVEPSDAASQEFMLTNSGGSASGALTVELSGSPAFAITADSCTAPSLGPRRSCSVMVEYSPNATGASDEATLSAQRKKKKGEAQATLTLLGSGGGHIYWTNGPPTNRIGRANLDGSGANAGFITGASNLTGVAVGP